ncbi:helix-turn-helix domain-containing protein [Nocardia asiatica]|uniref:helix-turn-helix domain-containing protein n=1 Tax=Nocardia asiatica TaxID=209252 RepID=UPI0024559AF0|nr:helix-turn-helix transcriptional regulator [Nocardia asiatica]
MGRVIAAYRTHPYHGRTLPQELLASWLGLTQAQLSRIEKGPPPDHLSKLTRWAQALAIPADLLWFKLPAASVVTLDDVKRQDFLRAALGVTATNAAAPLTDLVDPIQPTPVPSTVGATEISQIWRTAREFSAWDHAYGGGLVREAVSAQLRYAVNRGKVLSAMARQAVWCGNPDDGLTYIEFAMVRSDRLTATERAMLQSARARALAKLHRVEEAAWAVGQADEEFSRASPQNDPPWMSYYDAAQHSGDTGHALFDLALQGRFVSEARDRLEAAVAGHTDTYVRSRAISGIKLASLTMATGDPREATAFGMAALVDAGHIRSRRAADDLRELAGFAEQHRTATDIDELRTRIDATMAGV